jgi:pimeloyl-ACP methyl ester carboxylesterase
LGGFFYFKGNFIMESNFIQIEDLNIHYIEKNGQQKNALFFIHGNSCSVNVWQKQLTSEFFNNYRLIAIDLPGHGKSSHSNNPSNDYSPIGTANILSEVVKKLVGTNPHILIGFSYGTNVVAEMLNYGIEPKGIVLVASCVLGDGHGMEKVFVQNEIVPIAFYNEPELAIVEKWFAKELISATKHDLQILADDYLKVSSDFKPVLFKTAGEGKISDEILALQKSNIPVCVLFGDKDKIVNIDYLSDLPFSVWKNQIYKIPEAGHWVNIDKVEECNFLIDSYAHERFNLV